MQIPVVMCGVKLVSNIRRESSELLGGNSELLHVPCYLGNTAIQLMRYSLYQGCLIASKPFRTAVWILLCSD